MKHFIEIEQTNGHVAYRTYTKLIEQFSVFLGESCLLEEPSSCHGLRVIVNPNLSLFDNVNKINERLYWAFFSDNMLVGKKPLNNFILRSLHLNFGELEGVDNVLVVLMPTVQQADNVSKQNEQPTNGNSTSDSEEETSAPAYMAVKPKYTLDKVIMTEKTDYQIRRAINLIQNQKKIFDEWGFSEIDPNTKTILCFYGAPGTGKTMCAHAIASELEKSVMIASYASIESKWVGEGPKNLKKIFKDAAEQDAVLFFDEADSFLSKRVANAETGSDKHYNRMSNEMFQLLEEYNGVVVFATNLVADFDKAFKSRILAFVEFEKPDKEARIKLIKGMIPNKLPLNPLTTEEYEKLSSIADGFCGREIRKAMLTSLAEGALRGVDSLTYSELESGFMAIKAETLAVEKTMKDDKSILQDFISEHTTNSFIMDVCLKAVSQTDEFSDELKKSLYLVSKVLNLDMPDMSISYRNKDIGSAIQNIVENDRQSECVKYCCELLALTSVSSDRKVDILQSILSEFKIQETEPYLELLNTLITLNKQ